MYDVDTPEAAERQRRIFQWLRIVGTGNSIAFVPVLVFLAESRLDRAIGVVLAIANAWATGAAWSRHRRLALWRADASEAVRPVDLPRPERQALLARLNERLGVYPNLWPSLVPIVVAMVTVVGAVVVAVLG